MAEAGGGKRSAPSGEAPASQKQRCPENFDVFTLKENCDEYPQDKNTLLSRFLSKLNLNKDIEKEYHKLLIQIQKVESSDSDSDESEEANVARLRQSENDLSDEALKLFLLNVPRLKEACNYNDIHFNICNLWKLIWHWYKPTPETSPSDTQSRLNIAFAQQRVNEYYKIDGTAPQDIERILTNVEIDSMGLEPLAKVIDYKIMKKKRWFFEPAGDIYRGSCGNYNNVISRRYLLEKLELCNNSLKNGIKPPTSDYELKLWNRYKFLWGQLPTPTPLTVLAKGLTQMVLSGEYGEAKNIISALIAYTVLMPNFINIAINIEYNNYQPILMKLSLNETMRSCFSDPSNINCNEGQRVGWIRVP
jgi:hypothetical protein